MIERNNKMYILPVRSDVSKVREVPWGRGVTR